MLRKKTEGSRSFHLDFVDYGKEPLSPCVVLGGFANFVVIAAAANAQRLCLSSVPCEENISVLCYLVYFLVCYA